MLKLVHVVVVIATVLIASSSCDSDCEGEEALRYCNVDECSYYYDLLENALLNDSDNVFRLQQTFFPQHGDPPDEVSISVNISVNEIVNGACPSDFCFNFSEPSFSEAGEFNTKLEWWSPHPAQTQVEKMIPSDAAVTSMFESVFFLFSGGSLHNDYDYYNYDGQIDCCKIELQLDQLPCNPCWDSTYYTLAHILTWAKAYARARGRPKTLDESDRGEVDDVWYYGYSYFNSFFLFLGFVFLNVLVMLLMLRFVPGYYHKFVSRVNDVNSDTRHLYHNFYWGCALVFFILAMSLHVLDLGVYVAYLPLVKPYYILSIAMICIFTKVVIMVLELILCVYVCKRNPITLHIPFQKCTTNVIFCFCFCACCSSARKSRVVQTLTLWGQMVVVQHITAGLIPLCFVIAQQPAETLSILALCASTLFCTIIFVTHLLHLRQVTGRQQRIAFCIQMFAILCFVGFVIMSISVYIIYLVAGAEFSGLGGFLGSLIPSVLLSAVGWYIKKKFLDTKTSTDPTQPTTPNLATESDQHGTTDGVLETVVHRNTPAQSFDSDSEQVPLLRHTN